MKKTIILLVLMVPSVAAAISAGSRWTTSSPPPKPGKRKEADFSPMMNPSFVELDLLTAPFVRGGKFVQYVVLVVNLEVASDDGVDKVRAVMPRLRDAFVTELHTMATMRNPDQKMLQHEAHQIAPAGERPEGHGGWHRARGAGAARPIARPSGSG